MNNLFIQKISKNMLHIKREQNVHKSSVIVDLAAYLLTNESSFARLQSTTSIKRTIDYFLHCPPLNWITDNRISCLL